MTLVPRLGKHNTNPRRLLALVILMAGLGFLLMEAGHSQPSPGTPLDLAQYRLTFNEEFHSLSISPHGPNTTWIAHTPWNGDFGDARFADPAPGFPFTLIDGGGLRIEARKGENGKWESGLVCSRDADGAGATGFAQKYGYFEMRAKLPRGPGTWPGFWLIGVDKQKSSAEIDILEQYGAFPNVYHTNIHIWRHGSPSVSDGHLVTAPPGALWKKFNTYGVLIDSGWMKFYFNRREVWRTQTAPEFRQPFYILADLALGSGWPINKTPNPSFMDIDYIRAYQKAALR
jgi:hypothetical protein